MTFPSAFLEEEEEEEEETEDCETSDDCVDYANLYTDVEWNRVRDVK